MVKKFKFSGVEEVKSAENKKANTGICIKDLEPCYDHLNGTGIVSIINSCPNVQVL